MVGVAGSSPVAPTKQNPVLLPVQKGPPQGGPFFVVGMKEGIFKTFAKPPLCEPSVSLMENKPPILLVGFAAAYLAYELWVLIPDFTLAAAVRLVLTVVLFFFVFRGSRIAGNILAIITAITALMPLVAAVAIFGTNLQASAVLTVFAGLLLALAAYFFSPDVRAFQRRASAVGTLG